MNTNSIILSIVIVPLMTAVSSAFFTDSFDSATLNPRWTNDNSPQNPSGSNITVIAGQAKGANTCQNYYNHLETPIDTSGEFAVQIDTRHEQPGFWGASLVVHWDPTHFIALKALKGGYFRSDVYNGSSFTMTNSSLTYPGAQICTLRIEFSADTIKFYAKNQTDPALIHLSNLDRTRSAWTKTPAALLIVGKGFQSNAYTTADYDNDYPFSPGNTDQLILDNAVYESIGPWCGQPGTAALNADINADCYVNLADFTQLAARWLWCSDLGIPDCDQFWQTDLNVWQIDPYVNFTRNLAPGPQNPPIQSLDVKLAQGEFRDALFMLGPYAQDRTLDITLDTSPGLPPGAIVVQETLYLLSYENESWTTTIHTGDAVYPLTGPLVIPAGESRQIRLRFDARYSGITPNDYKFAVLITDADTAVEQRIPGSLTVWDFQLPSNDVLRNNSYAHFNNSEFNGLPYSHQAFVNAVQAMKLYGVNSVYYHGIEMPHATEVDNNGNILTYDSTTLEYRLDTVLQSWHDAPGDEKLEWVFLFYDLTLGMTRTDIVYPSDLWKTVFAQWLSRFKTILAAYGVTDDQWSIILGDEEDAQTLMNYTIPLAELIKSIDPAVKLYCNSSAYLIYPTWRNRYLAVFDTFSPHITKVEGPSGQTLLNSLQSSGKSVTSYRCCPDAGRLDAELYNYYRVYGWKVARYNLDGLGHWTYCAQGFPPWEDRVNLGYILAFKHWASDDIVRSRRYEMHREAMDDYRYIYKLRQVAAQVGGSAPDDAEALIDQAIDDILANLSDHTRCDTWRVEIAHEILRLSGLSVPADYFVDEFAAFDTTRWTEDNSPQNPPGSEFYVWDVPQWLIDAIPLLAEGHQLTADTGLREAFHHVQTTIDTSASFQVETSIRSDAAMGAGAAHLGLYWDENHYVALTAPQNYYFAREFNNGSGYAILYDTSAVVGITDWHLMKIELTDTAVNFYAGIRSLPYLPALEIPRESWMTGDALLIAGRGNPSGGGLDFDNSEPDPGAATWLAIDYVKYQPATVWNCGDPGTKYLTEDVNRDCRVDYADIVDLAAQWLWCDDPLNADCR